MMTKKDIERLEKKSGVAPGKLMPSLIVMACVIIILALLGLRLIIEVI